MVPRRLSKRLKLALGAALILLAATGAAGVRLNSLLRAPYPDSPTPARRFVVEEGQSGSRIAQRLEQEGLIRSAWLFRLLLRYRGPDYQLRAGEYRFDQPLNMLEVADRLHRGRVHHYRVTVPEGLDRREVAAAWARAGFGPEAELLREFASPALIQDLDPAARNLEGYLAPETYLVTAQETPAAITRLMIQHFRELWDDRRRARAQELGLSLREAVTLASLVEKEASLAGERRLVAAVFHNRLRRNMKLECDPTIIFAVKEIKPFDGIIHRSDLQLDSPYNTYLYPGLPPGPICNPGVAALDAALNPAPVDYLFFVARNDGSHVFSETYREHQRAVMEFQRK